jgi:hypothetical protein
MKARSAELGLLPKQRMAPSERGHITQVLQSLCIASVFKKVLLQKHGKHLNNFKPVLA